MIALYVTEKRTSKTYLAHLDKAFFVVSLGMVPLLIIPTFLILIGSLGGVFSVSKKSLKIPFISFLFISLLIIQIAIKH